MGIMGKAGELLVEILQCKQVLQHRLISSSGPLTRQEQGNTQGIMALHR